MLLFPLLASGPDNRHRSGAGLDHVQGFGDDAASFGSEVMQTGIPKLSIGFVLEPALVDE
jgi:hypothetical protein